MTPPEGFARPTRAELLVDGVVHALAILIGGIAYAMLLRRVAADGDALIIWAMAVYAAGYFLMFGCSLAYNMTPSSPLKLRLQRFDHAAIFIMIAGTYTALLTAAGLGIWTLPLLVFVWLGAVGGVLLRFLAPALFERFSIFFYLALGWAGLFAIWPLSQQLPVSALTLLVAGGITYVAGLGFFFWNGLRFQTAIWHGFVAMAAAMQFAAVALAL